MSKESITWVKWCYCCLFPLFFLIHQKRSRAKLYFRLQKTLLVWLEAHFLFHIFLKIKYKSAKLSKLLFEKKDNMIRNHERDKINFSFVRGSGGQTKSRHNYLVPILELLENWIRSLMFVPCTEKHCFFFNHISLILNSFFCQY